MSQTLSPPPLDPSRAPWPAAPPGDEELFLRLRALCDEGAAITAGIVAAREGRWHSFLPADYAEVLGTLLGIRARGGRFLELGSAIGVIAIMADLLGFEAYGIEVAPELVVEARGLAARHGSAARFAAGSYLPAGYRWAAEDGDTRLGAMGVGEPAYAELGLELAEFDWVYAFPWPGEAAVLRDLMRRRGAPGARLLLHE